MAAFYVRLLQLYSTSKEILNFYNLPLENSMVPQPRGVADIKCNSPIKLS